MEKFIKKTEIFRRIFHLLVGGIVSCLYYFDFFSRNQLLIALSAAFALVIFIEHFRAENPKLNAFCLRFLKLIVRKKEIKGLSGIPFYLFGCFFVILVFNKSIALLSILFLAAGDPTAGLFGKLFGHWSFKFDNGKSYIGFVSSSIVCSLLTYSYYRYCLPIIPLDSKFIAFCMIAGLIGGVSELISFIDDNSFIPIFSGLLLLLLHYWMKVPGELTQFFG